VNVTNVGDNVSTENPCSPPAESTTPKNTPPAHLPVLLEESVHFLAPVDGETYVDGTLGLGGHSEKILQTCGPSGKVIGFEWDANALALAQERLKPFGERFTGIHRSYTEIMKCLAEMHIPNVDGLLLDLGISSLQLDTGSRGFSHQAEGPLDMRMDERSPLTAEYLINTYSKDELADIFYYLGEEKQARRIASHVVAAREKKRIETTAELAGIVAAAIPKKFHPRKIHVATKVFQALRIAVNRELENLSEVLDSITEILKPGGRVCIISFHSLEDRLVKWKLRQNPLLRVLTPKPVTPGYEEIRKNPRARSAKLRAACMEG
jgi:16S rRNA (cytosine1402-N4)-methyltransferase